MKILVTLPFLFAVSLLVLPACGGGAATSGSSESAEKTTQYAQPWHNPANAGWYCAPDLDAADDGEMPWQYCEADAPKEHYYIPGQGKGSGATLDARKSSCSENARRRVRINLMEALYDNLTGMMSSGILTCCPADAAGNCLDSGDYTYCNCLVFAKRL